MKERVRAVSSVYISELVKQHSVFSFVSIFISSVLLNCAVESRPIRTVFSHNEGWDRTVKGNECINSFIA